MQITRPYRLMLWSSAAALLLAGVLVWKERQDRVNPIVHGERLNRWVAELDRIPAKEAPNPFGVTIISPPMVDYILEVPQLGTARTLAFLQTRNSLTCRLYTWCQQQLPKPLSGSLPHPWVCQHPRRVLETLEWALLEPEPALRMELESICQGPEAGLREAAFQLLFRNGYSPRRFYPRLLDAAPIIAAGLQAPSPRVQQIALKLVGELQTEHRLSEWPRTLPPLIPLLEPLAEKSGDLAVRFEADGLLRDLGVRRPAAVAISPPDQGNASAEPSRLFQTVDWNSLNSSASNTLVLPPRADMPGKVIERNFGAGFSAEPARHLRE